MPRSKSSSEQEGRAWPKLRRAAFAEPTAGQAGNSNYVVETTNFTNKTSYRGAGEHLRLIERFTRTAPELLTYRVTIDDPTTFTRPWTVELPVVRSNGQIHEYACHEANYGLEGILRGHRAEELRAATAAKKSQP